ncbi:MAG: tetratricopeptide repeat protein [Acidobacteriia bacterium]|nr:tetratricopeptide repeat protein [Terriglobia bacterium]
MGKAKKTSTNASSGRIPDEPAAPLNPRLMMEQALRDIQKVLQEHEFADMDEANAYLAKLSGGGFKNALRNTRPLSPQEEAQEIADQAMQAPTARKGLALARQALAKDADCVDALVVLAGAASKSDEQYIAGLEKAVAAGERSLGADYFEENKGHFWGLVETRPYMRARATLAEFLFSAGRMPEAISHFEGILALNPNDNQGVRDRLLNCYLASGDLKGAQRLLRQYHEDCSAVFNWGKTMERFLAGDQKGAERALQLAQKDNRFVGLYFTGKKTPPRETPPYYSPGSEEEAQICLETLAETLIAHPKLVMWLMTSLMAEDLSEMNRRLRRMARRGNRP